ncbi:MAG: histidine--tRNA ligase [Deltaproteobacteria bacterium]|nr:histidine--tRNA ligase [Deltaproteobacteria bacterium]
MDLKVVKGMRDIVEDEMIRFQFLERKAREVFRLYGYEEIRTPLLEMTDLFKKGVGEDTDIIGKEMYLLKDRRDQSLALRPEGTASVVRSVINNNLLKKNKTVKYFYMGPMFRFERPQKGRYRQFHQIGIEFFGVPSADADLETLLMLNHYLTEIELFEISFELNSIGCLNENCRPAFKERLKSHLNEKKDRLCENCNRRINTNPLRVLDCKVKECIEATRDAPSIVEFLCGDCSRHFDELLRLLSGHKVKFNVNPRLVRGLDYYSKTVFEVYSNNLGAQNAVGGGGRFDYLFEVYGESPVPSIGFALGTDRLSMLLPQREPQGGGVFILGQDRELVSKLAADCRLAGIVSHYDPFLSSMKSQMRQANRHGVQKTLIVGEEEISQKQVAVKDMHNGEQENISMDLIIQYLNQALLKNTNQ